MNSVMHNLQPVSVLIVNYNAGPLLVQCAHAALEQAQEVIVVDNASTDSSIEKLIDCLPKENRLNLIATGKNSGFAAGCNVGLAASTQPYILFLNPDCVLSTGSLQRMVQVMESDPHIGMVGGYLVNP